MAPEDRCRAWYLPSADPELVKECDLGLPMPQVPGALLDDDEDGGA